MPSYVDFSLGKFEDAILSLNVNPAIPIGGMNIRFLVQHRFGGLSGFAIKSVASGFNNQSGINITNSGLGQMQININSVDSSGLDFGAYAFTAERMDPGTRTLFTAGYWLITPSSAP